MNRRENEFQAVTRAIGSAAVLRTEAALVVEGDSLPVLQDIPDGSISLIVTDPPYHATKKHNIFGDTKFEDDDQYLAWLALYVREWRRILRPNGSIYCFCDQTLSSRIEALFYQDYNVLSHIVWTKPNEPGFDGWKQKMKKEALRQFYPHSERVIFAEPAIPGSLFKSHFAVTLKALRKTAGLTTYQLTEAIGAYGKVNHGGAVSNWEAGRNVPSRDQYALMCQAFKRTGRVKATPAYEDIIRPFHMSGDREFTDIWNFPSVRPYKGKHPAEKPLSMLEHIVFTSSYPGDIVLDCFAGSGSTAAAATKLGRRAVSIEVDPHWTDMAKARLAGADEASVVIEAPRAKLTGPKPRRKFADGRELNLFD
ncbi:hypothetical protein NBEOAGPD_2812 [Methylobacterium gregans]|jgi:adenine-specific DNA-methyltransferase|uniref:Methyltransferase n=1 Tax=Methylobacterium gregans TaxID=374424 RepID=A0AA37HPT2_9HYPH|nr:hypothetical protein NBEOAGPD_2812 [Methylobacterium gregans]